MFDACRIGAYAIPVIVYAIAIKEAVQYAKRLLEQDHNH